MKVTVKLSEWYAQGNVPDNGIFYDPSLLNEKGQQCCLGFCAASHGVEKKQLMDVASPEKIRGVLSPDDWMTKGCTPMMPSDLADMAIRLNDGCEDYYTGDITDWSDQPLSVRMGNLITVFAEGGDELEFVP